MVLHILTVPDLDSNGLGTGLLGLGNAGALQGTVGVVTAHANVTLAVFDDDDVLHLTTGLLAHKVQVLLLSQGVVATLKDGGDALGGGNTQLLLQLLDVLHGFFHVASGIADGEDTLIVQLESLTAICLLQSKIDFAHVNPPYL